MKRGHTEMYARAVPAARHTASARWTQPDIDAFFDVCGAHKTARTTHRWARIAALFARHRARPLPFLPARTPLTSAWVAQGFQAHGRNFELIQRDFLPHKDAAKVCQQCSATQHNTQKISPL